MPNHLNLVESDFEALEKRVLPRFPFCYLTFKCSASPDHVFEVKDISYSGMQIALKSGDHGLTKDQTIHGHIHWNGKELELSGSVAWDTDMRLGVEFSNSATSRAAIDKFLDIDSLAAHLKPVHLVDYGVELPAKLKYWLRADGPIEVFIWKHNDGELAKFQILIMENFVEWEDVKGLKTARVISKRDIDTPLINEDEIVFKIDPSLDDEKISRALSLVRGISEKSLSTETLDFLQLKLRS